MKPKLLYCLALVGVLFILSFTVIQREASKSCTLACKEADAATNNATESTTDFILIESLTKYLVVSIKR
ncbi:MAG TPA: hypothetical protein VF622_13810 [Segetibacter sp.]|jgi:hypothetical protein